jgi:hypothetical protein
MKIMKAFDKKVGETGVNLRQKVMEMFKDEYNKDYCKRCPAAIMHVEFQGTYGSGCPYYFKNPGCPYEGTKTWLKYKMDVEKMLRKSGIKIHTD